MSTRLREREGLPPGFLDCDAPTLAAQLGGPTLCYLDGERSRPLFVAILVHGNEITGLQALQALLAGYRGRPLPRALILFIANTAAAAQGMRQLPEQPDWNRIWPGADGVAAIAPCAETEMAAEVYARIAARKPFAVVDVHNNNGRNPHYACVNRLDPTSLQFAGAFTRRVLYFVTPRGTLTDAFAELAPAVTLECGPVGEAAGAAHAAAFLEHSLRRAGPARGQPETGAVEIFRTVARITVPPEMSIGVGAETAQLHLAPDLEARNWVEAPAGTVLAQVEGVAGIPLQVRDSAGADCAHHYLRRRGACLELARPMIPAMLTVDTRIIRQDCLCYLLERLCLADARRC